MIKVNSRTRHPPFEEKKKKKTSLCFWGSKIQIKRDKRTSENSKSGNPQTCDTFIITSFRQLILGFFFPSIFNQERGLFIWEHDSLISWSDFFLTPSLKILPVFSCSARTWYTVYKVFEQISCVPISLGQIFVRKNPVKIPHEVWCWPMKWSAICQTPISDS